MIYSANLAGLGSSLNISSIVGLSFGGRYSKLTTVILYSQLGLSEFTTLSIQNMFLSVFFILDLSYQG